jgi:osmotically-inducible protein OsmY
MRSPAIASAVVLAGALLTGACERETATPVDTEHGALNPDATADTSQTPDGLITTTIQGKYAASDEVKGYRINVDTNNGVVTLNGSVDSADHRAEAVRLARETQGVRDVRDMLTVGADTAATTGTSVDDRAAGAARGAGEALSDGWITTKIQGQYALDARVKGHEIDVDTKDGVVTLTGSVETEAQKKAAEDMARATDGVKRVVNNLRVS